MAVGSMPERSMIGRVAIVTPSLLKRPVSLAGSRTGLVGLVGAIVSRVKVNLATFPFVRDWSVAWMPMTLTPSVEPSAL